MWAWWWELNTRRPPGFESLAPLPFHEIDSWIRLTGRFVSPEEIDWLIQMDNAWIGAVAEEKAARREREKAEAERNKQTRRGR